MINFAVCKKKEHRGLFNKSKNMIPNLNQTDTQQLTEALAKVYPADDAKCDLRTGWSFNEGTKLMTFSLTCLVSAIEDKQDVDINKVFNKMQKCATEKGATTLDKRLGTFTGHTTEPYNLDQIDVVNMKEMGWVFYMTIKAASVFSSFAEMEETLQIS